MARRAASHVSNDSQKENNGFTATNGSSSKSATTTRSKRAAMRDHGDVHNEEEHVEDNEDGDMDADGEADGEGEEGDEDEDEDQSPKARKRARANTNGDSRPIASGSGPKQEKRGQTLPRDEDGFIPGSIVRIQLQNFLTYDWVEFCPGPYLNMIFGPNGTGKSSIACAICLGLNFPPTVLGRAQELKSFVKNNKNEGHIEIELKGAKGKRNLVIRRSLQSNSKSAPFTLNGKSASGKEINARMAELNVQVSNLCTFLPQDRVAEFARMTPQQLLRETQRAAGNENLTSWHDTLISSGKELRQIQELANADREQLKTMEERNANLERDVRRYQERLALEQRIELLELIVPFTQYYAARDVYRKLKPLKKEKAKALQRLQKRNAPFVEKKQALEGEIKQRERAREEMKSAVKRMTKQLSDKWRENEQLDTQTEDLKNKLDGLKKAEKDRVTNIRKLEKQIEEAEQKLANPPETENLEDIQNEIRRLTLQNNATIQRQSDLHEKQKANIEKGSQTKFAIKGFDERLRRLDSDADQKLDALRKFDPDCADVVVWVRQNRHRFRSEVLEPALLCVTVPNRSYADAVEACFGNQQMRTIVAQCEEDYQLINRLCVDTPEAIGRKAKINTWFKPVDASKLPPPPLPAEQLRALGFDGYAIDFIDCPNGLKWFLCSDVRLHRTAIASRPQAVDGNKAMEMAANAGGANYIIGRTMNQVTRSKYGKRLPQNTTRNISQARNFVHAPVDPQVKKDLQRQLLEAQEHLRIVQEEEKELSEEEKVIQAAAREFRTAHKKLEDRKRAVIDTQKELRTLGVKLQVNRDKLRNLQNAPPVDVERNRLKQDLLTLASKRVAVVRQYIGLMHTLIKEQAKSTHAFLEIQQVHANKTALEQLCKEQNEEMTRAQEEFFEVHERYTLAKKASMDKLAASKNKLEESSEELRQQFSAMDEANELSKRTTEEWQADLARCEQELEMKMATNADVVDRYNRRKDEIDALKATLHDREKRANRIEQGIKTARDNWKPELEKLVGSIGQKFSAAFDRIGCAGEIRIREDDDFEKWAIDIMVKFRDHEKLQLLTGERQSGGERSLTTILYLMSLTEEARAPFSLVDEINQGMDQRAERAVHNSLVEVTCKPDAGQYFLITPKLLPDLHYHERMKILCVNNGEWLPEPDGKSMGNMMSLIDNHLRFRAAAARANAST